MYLILMTRKKLFFNLFKLFVHFFSCGTGYEKIYDEKICNFKYYFTVKFQ